jgi:transposase
MPQCSAWMKRPPSRPWIARIRFCRCPRDAQNGTVLSTFVTAPCRCTLPATRETGEVLGKTAARHTSAEFVAFFTDIVIDQPRGKEIHVMADNLSAHKSKPVMDYFLAVHSKVHLHFTPTYSSWLNQVELWFSKIERDVIARGVFTSVSDLKRKLMRYIRQYNKSPRSVNWKYADPLYNIST